MPKKNFISRNIHLLSFILILVFAETSILLIKFIDRQYNNMNKELAQNQNTIANLKKDLANRPVETVVTKQKEEAIKTDATDESKEECNNPEDNSIYTEDHKYYYEEDSSTGYRICLAENNELLNNISTQTQMGKKYVITFNLEKPVEKGILFILDKSNETLSYIDTTNLQDSNAKVVIGPADTNKIESWSPSGRFILFSTTECQSCGTDITTYALNVSTLDIYKVGLNIKDYEWVSGGIKWTSSIADNSQVNSNSGKREISELSDGSNQTTSAYQTILFK